VISRRLSVEEMVDSSGGPPLAQRHAVWSIYGAERAQPVATGGKCDDPENGSNKPIGNRWQPTATASDGKEGVDGSSPSDGFASSMLSASFRDLSRVAFCARHPPSVHASVSAPCVARRHACC